MSRVAVPDTAVAPQDEPQRVDDDSFGRRELLDLVKVGRKQNVMYYRYLRMALFGLGSFAYPSPPSPPPIFTSPLTVPAYGAPGCRPFVHVCTLSFIQTERITKVSYGHTRLDTRLKQKTGKKDDLYVVSQLPTSQYSVLEEIHMKIHIEGL